ncbi:xylulokinase/erythritol kinase [Streptomyces sp. Amel2xB2]|uniref:FGGY-family carbohydrate kinase n=1 Tax=Streptomyces sp. Amel2xB2 TaxID=1305829 RepID=UPI000DB97FA4|nr:FGGY-family carbohydrate kinase [Streptomyces sp. Amel2xB2]RAJ70067.1 xylulokinase/erythritol kinase [Streptomyces sp. Amel2xB2]
MIIGVDIGTTVTKAAVFDDAGRSVVEADAPSRLNHPGPGRVEQDLGEVLDTVTSVVRRVAAEHGGTVDAVALTGQGDGLWLRDAEGTAVRPPLSWLDGRANDLVDHWWADGTAAEVHRLTGQAVFPGCPAPLLATLRKEEPESLERAAVAGYCVDAVAQLLTGEITVDASDASLPFLDVRTGRYDEDAIAACGLQDLRGLLAEPSPPGRLLSLDARGAALLGLPKGTPVTAGPFDLPASLFGSGLAEPGDGLLTVGTTLACQVLSDRPAIGADAPDQEPAGMWLCTADPALWSRAMPAMVGTASIDWLLRLLRLSTDDVAELLRQSPPGARGVSALPFLAESGERAPFVAPRARGQLTGVTLTTERADVVRAVCESVAYAARHCLESAGLDGRLAICGGGSRSDEWTQVFADALGRPVLPPSDHAVGARGAAAVAARALGGPVDTAGWLDEQRAVLPRREHRAGFEDGYERYLTHLESARRLW